jgi:acyl dehydratase
VNYGFNKIRFVSPVRSGARIRGRFTLAELTQIRPGEVQFMMQVTVEIEGQDKPALVAEWLSRRYFEGETA